MTFLFIRPAAEGDVDGLSALAAEAGTGMTTVPTSRDAIAERIDRSKTAFSGTDKAAAADTFFFVLEDPEGIAGMACIFPNLGEDRPFYSYRLSTIAAQAPEIGLQASSDALFLVNDFHGYAEIGTLLVSKRLRGQGAGRFLSLSRLMFLGLYRERFGEHVMAEIRGWFDAAGNSPFWDNIGARFFNTTFEEADRLSAHDFRFISHLMPKFPIYVPLIHPAAQEAIGKPHDTSQHAMNLLTSEGFTWRRCIDIFDGGPSLESPIDKVRTVVETDERRATIAAQSDHIAGAEPFQVARMKPEPFAVVRGMAHRDGKTVVIAPEDADRAGIRNGELVAASPIRG